jgi:hypothetical protein
MTTGFHSETYNMDGFSIERLAGLAEAVGWLQAGLAVDVDPRGLGFWHELRPNSWLTMNARFRLSQPEPQDSGASSSGAPDGNETTTKGIE